VVLPAPTLDDREFQDPVDDARRLVRRRCPDWTGRHGFDPGDAPIEVFAGLVEQLIHRLSRVPDLNDVKFLELVGLELRPPAAAPGTVTIWLSAPPPQTVVRAETEVATPRTGPGSTGWAFGRTVRAYEVNAALAHVPGVDTAEEITVELLSADSGTRGHHQPMQRLPLAPAAPVYSDAPQVDSPPMMVTVAGCCPPDRAAADACRRIAFPLIYERTIARSRAVDLRYEPITDGPFGPVASTEPSDRHSIPGRIGERGRVLATRRPGHRSHRETEAAGQPSLGASTIRPHCVGAPL
jgi:hypothetical protein